MAKSLYRVIAETKIDTDLLFNNRLKKIIKSQINKAIKNYQQRPGEGMLKRCSQIAYKGIVRLAEIGEKGNAIKYVPSYNKTFNIK
ncbi:hypothetical protein KAJ87_02290 [Candidatus Pacearchaeota archaeon]|nr:hypothetical protein [Candidatus Pacearchaeota archaeon]